MSSHELTEWRLACLARLERELQRWLTQQQAQAPGQAAAAVGRLIEAMAYGSLNGGKRLRALLCYASAEAVGLPARAVDGLAVALELVHAYSLIHDDLPAMDDDDLRRGQPSTHRAFDEATAILAGDALQALAFEIIAIDTALAGTAADRLQVIAELASAIGALGMCGGQALDLAAEGQQPDQTQLEDLFARKTGRLIGASVTLPARLGTGDPRNPAALAKFGDAIGLAFQIQDDVLDIEASTEVLGKPQGRDADLDKATWPALFGLDAAKARAAELHEQALIAIEPFGAAAARLRQLAELMLDRTH